MSAIEGWSRLQTALTASSWDWLVPGDPLCCYGVQATRFARTAQLAVQFSGLVGIAVNAAKVLPGAIP